ncbi:hypothetical protein [Vibrio parahaemolyticus]|uniref:hypothetical protein n=1 Tax=Vibrio parahaemolyticus TaxID=670 RepID=UPI00215D2C25|nr:hypothetical protein [Vibrio parahaemolyticus]MCR9819759.1 hypothetical protein [Vibrio parahaemolyticus]
MNVRVKFKPLLLATALPLMLAGCQPTTITPSEPETYEMAMENIEKACPTCEMILGDMLKAMNQQCDFPLTQNSVRLVGRSHPVYGFSLAANTMLADNESTKQMFNKAVINNVNCWNADDWITSIKGAMAENEHFQSLTTNTIK